MKKYLFIDTEYIPDKKTYDKIINSLKGSGTPITTTCIKPSYFNDVVIRETSPGIYPLQQKEYIKRNGTSNANE